MDSTEGGVASTDLQKRIKTILKGIEGRSVGTDALFDVVKLEVLDWRLDHGVDTEGLQPAAETAETVNVKAPPEEEAAS